MKLFKLSWVQGLTAGFIFSLIFLWSTYGNFGLPPGRDHLDFFLVITMVKHWTDVGLGTWRQIGQLPSMYGIAWSAFFTDHHLLQAVFAFPLYILTGNIIMSANLLAILMMIFSFAAMYVWLFWLTASFWASIVGSLVFVYNPYVFSRFPDQMILYTLWPIPLIFYFFEQSLYKPTNRNVFGFFLMLAAEVLSSLYYSVYLSIIVPVYAVIRLRQTKTNIRALFRWETMIGFVILIAILILTYIVYKYSLTSAVLTRTSVEIEYFYAAWPVDWLFASPAFYLWGAIGTWMSQFFGSVLRSGSREEMSLFWGATPLMLFLLSFWQRKKSPRREWIMLAWALMALAFVLSLGPRIHLSLASSFPNIVYQALWSAYSFLGYLRATGRWAVMVYFFLASIAALTWSTIEKGLTRQKKIIFSLVIILLISLEYYKRPTDYWVVSSEQQALYQRLRAEQHIRTIVDLPIANDLPAKYPQSRMNFLDARYLLWATAYHNKNILNGYSGYVSTELITRGKLLSVNFPTPEKLRLLRRWGVDAIVVHEDELNDKAEFVRIKSALLSSGAVEKDHAPGLALFTIMNVEP